jgi:glucose 1-dehydrogenase
MTAPPERNPARPLEGRRAIVTGASRGIGAAIALACGAAGARVLVNYAGSADEAQEVARQIAGPGKRSSDEQRALCVRADVSREDQVEAMFAAAINAWGSVDLLVNNAGIQKDAPAHDMTLADWQRVIDVNLTGAFLCARAAVREFRRRGTPAPGARAVGTILCISSVHEIIPWAGHVNYATTKAGIQMLVKTLAQEYAAERIRVNGIAPGAIRTDINPAAWETPRAAAALLKLIPYGRIGDPDDIARAAVWLASDDADYVNGTTLLVDGGMALYPAFRGGG